jgi:hypothetical protein
VYSCAAAAPASMVAPSAASPIVFKTFMIFSL